MIKKVLLLCAAVCLFAANNFAQTITSLHETFDSVCATSGLNYPVGWTEYNKLGNVINNAWNCTPIYGVAGTPCQQINAYYGSVYHLDSAWLITPAMDLSGYTTGPTLTFNSKYRFAGDLVAILISNNYAGGNPDSSIYTWTDISSTLAPAFGMADSLDWVYHKADLSGYETAPITIAFRYTSNTVMASRWNLDNVIVGNTEAVATINKEPFAMGIIGESSRSAISVKYETPETGSYTIGVYNIMGKEVCRKAISATGSASQTITIDGLSLTPGMYIVKMYNAANSRVCKTVVY